MSKLNQVITIIGERQPLQQKQISKTFETLTPKELASAERTLSFFTDEMSYSLTDISNAYQWFVNAFMDAQINFAHTGRYLHSTFAEIEEYYKDAKTMKNYIVSLAMTLYLFPQHIAVQRFYESSLKSATQATGYLNTSFLEIGPGHGHLFVAAMENSNFSQYTAVDISQPSVDATIAYAEYCSPGKRNWNVLRKDFFEFDSTEKFNAIVMGEVLEHVEQPRNFLNKIRDLAMDDAFIYITTAVNAPCFDHIYYFGAVEEVERMFTECGFAVKDKVYGIANGVDFDKAVRKKYTIVPAYVLQKV